MALRSNALASMLSMFLGLVALAGCQADVAGPNRAPVADAGPDRVFQMPGTITLDGSRSYDPDGDDISLEWKIVKRPPLAGADFNPPYGVQVTLEPDVAGIWIVTLTVSDGRLASTRDVIRVLATRACEVDADCDDHDACTSDTCAADGRCQYASTADRCDDGLICNGLETCDPADGCQPGSPPACDDGVDCTADACDEGVGGCTYHPDDLLCEDGNPCTDGTCDPNAGCQFAAGNDGTACSVGACDGTCDAGLCLGCTCDVPSDCDDGIACTVEACNGGACSYTANDLACDDGAWCNGAETCSLVAGCQAGALPICDDGVACTQDSCDEANDRCANVATDGLCDDGAWCNGAETCDRLLGCQVGVPPSCTDGIACTLDACDEAGDTCSNLATDALCDDGAYCNGFETCDEALGCQAGTPPDCNDAFACTQDSCDEGNDVCSHQPNDAACDDGTFCNGAETCVEGSGCQPGVAPDCDDGVMCTQDSCDAGTDLCVNAEDDGACDDGFWCTGTETCDAVAGCQPGADPCPGQSCDEGGQSCYSCSIDPDCDDGNFCNGAETCSGGACQAGAQAGTGDHCDGADLVSCDGSGNETGRTTCALGCNDSADPTRCNQLDPTNLDPAVVCAGGTSVVIAGPMTIDTDAGTISGVAGGDYVFSTQTQGMGLPEIAVFSFASLDVQDDVTVVGSRALALVTCGDLQVGGIIDACAAVRTGGPGGYDGGASWTNGSGYVLGAGWAGNGDLGNPYRRAGGGGGAHGGGGGRGGNDSIILGGAGGTAYGLDGDLSPLVGGSGGGGGAIGDGGGVGGGGGGAVQLVAGGSLTVEAGAGVDACGAGGAPPTTDARAGGGGGAGGGILLEAIDVSVDGTLAANGGGGGGGQAYQASAGSPGDDGPFANDRAAGGAGGGNAGNGGQAGGSDTPGGVQGQDSNDTAGGGGGGAGRVRINSASGAAVLGGTVSPTAASGLFTQGTVTID